MVNVGGLSLFPKASDNRLLSLLPFPHRKNNCLKYTKYPLIMDGLQLMDIGTQKDAIMHIITST